jgi:hypothetical protein
LPPESRRLPYPDLRRLSAGGIVRLFSGELGETPLEIFQFGFGEVLQVEQLVARTFTDADQLIELEMQCSAITVLRVLNKNTIRNVTIVVPVLMTSCQVSENWKAGPVTAQTTIKRQATAKVDARPHCRDVHSAAVLKVAVIEKGRASASEDLAIRFLPQGT